MARYRQFILEGVQHQPEIWSNLKGQIYLGDEAFVTEMQKKIGREKDDINIPQQQKRPIAKPLSEIAAQHKDRKTAIIAAHKTGAYSQREVGEFCQLHPTTIGVIVQKRCLILCQIKLCIINLLLVALDLIQSYHRFNH
jgi:putative transposase